MTASIAENGGFCVTESVSSTAHAVRDGPHPLTLCAEIFQACSGDRRN